MTGARVLVVDDDDALRQFVARNLAARGFEVTTARNGLEALALVDRVHPDLVVLDIMMPGLDGLETCRRIRLTSVMPIIVLTALDTEADKVRCLDEGADDCLVKPFGVDELLARVRSALRRVRWHARSGDDTVLRHRDLELDTESLRAAVRGREVDLTRTELTLLRYFMENAGKSLPHARILRDVWGPGYGGETQYVRVYVSRLRQKFEDDPAHPAYFVTEHGLGYRFGG
ncbi:response regulator transcription factor [Jiangella mangrovi]|uniref:Two-component system KDP operon response regulator KdpE n=1 Tax=Jiangella mangrovi TaxID=1524084 RepID=A0A7W9GSH3_9ACTN|nr:response regulator transcription factor [Jiangella mangrovi]MBB5788911.1 two-component system KDP operon response regulator KdpE [Jiangella mangrovi]